MLSILRAAEAVRLRVVTYNVHAWRDSNHSDNFDRVVDVVRRMDPDVLCLNEVLHPYDPAVFVENAAEYFDTVARGEGRGLVVPAPEHRGDSYLLRLARECGLPHVRMAEAERALCYFGDVPFGNAICSKTPFARSGEIALRSEAGDELLGEQPRDFAESRGAVWATLECGITVCTAHLDHKSEELREKQIKTCLDSLPRAIEGGGALVCGDLNTFQRADHSEDGWRAICDFYESRGWAAPRERSLVLDSLRDAGFLDAATCRVLEPGALQAPTCWTHNPLFRIDHLLLDQALRRRAAVLKLDTVHDKASDHFPVLLELDLDPPPN